MMSQKSPPHPWHESQPLYGRPQIVNSSFASLDNPCNNNTDNRGPGRGNGSSAPSNKASHHRRQRRRGPYSSSTSITSSSSEKTKRRSSRLWQLSEESIAGYAQWIREKSPVDQTPAERRFLWKYMKRHVLVLDNKNQGGKTRHLVGELQANFNRSAMEDAFLQQHYRRSRRDGKQSNDNNIRCEAPQAQESSSDTVIVWERLSNDNNQKIGGTMSSFFFRNGEDVTATGLKSLQESMKKLGLSLENLKEPMTTTTTTNSITDDTVME
jgi:hypothetical protein